ncbi:MAG TPA: trigger factor, partial [Candidatus Dormibacteraeota bacterium]|nr:trigger factor [Candidatus Dormibacteraeota bacterium]
DRGTMVPVERAAGLGDIVTIDYLGRIEGEPFEGGEAKGQVTELLEERFIPGFATGIAGMNAGESREVHAKFPDGYNAAELAGKEAIFSVTLHDVKELELPALDDAFAKDISDFEGLDALRAEVRTRLEAVASARVRREIGTAVMEQIVNAHEVALPPSLVESEREQLFEDARKMAEEQGAKFADYLTAIEKSEEQFRDDLLIDARRRVKGTLLIEAISQAEHILASPPEIDAELALLARRYGQPIESVRSALAGNMHALVEGIVRNKTLEFLIDKAQRVATP